MPRIARQKHPMPTEAEEVAQRILEEAGCEACMAAKSRDERSA